MKICNCFLDIRAIFCDVPSEWKDAIANAICFVISNKETPCNCVKKCETVTSLSPFTLSGSTLSVKFRDENGIINTRSVDLSQAIDSVLDETDPKCLMSQEEWDELTLDEKVQAVINGKCECCSTTTTSSTTTSTTVSLYNFYIADEWQCIDNSCKLVSDSVIVRVPNGFIFNPSYFYQGVENPVSIYQLISLTSATDSFVTIDGDSSFSSCEVFCPPLTTTTTTTSTTTTSSTTTTTTCCPITAIDGEAGSDATTTTSTSSTSTTTTTTLEPTTTTTSSTTTTTTEVPVTTTTSTSTSTSTSTTSTSSTTTTTTFAENIRIENTSLDVTITTFELDAITVPGGPYAAPVSSVNYNLVTDGTVDLYIEFDTSIGGQNITIYDTNNTLLGCYAVENGDPSPNITITDVDMTGPNRLLIEVNDGFCI